MKLKLSRRRFILGSCVILWTAAVSKPLLNAIARNYSHKHYTIEKSDIDPALENYSLLHLTDFHVGEDALINYSNFLDIIDDCIQYEKTNFTRKHKIACITWDL